MTGSSLDRITDAIHDVLHAGPTDRGWPEHPDECERCGAVGDDLVPMVHAVNRGRVRAHLDCGEAAGYVPDGACTGAPDLCGAPAGEPCRPGCPSLAADPS